MEAWVDRSVQLRDRARPKPEPVRNYTFEIGAALCVALIAATAWAVLAAGWVNGGGGAAVVAVTSVVEAALLAQARAPRIAAAIAAPFLGLAAIVPTTLAAMPPVAGQTAGSIAGHYVQALVTGLSSSTDWDFTVGLCAILFLCGYWLGWVALREHRGVLAVIPVFSVLATNVVNAKDPDPIAFPEMIAVVLALGRDRGCVPRSPRRPLGGGAHHPDRWDAYPLRRQRGGRRRRPHRRRAHRPSVDEHRHLDAPVSRTVSASAARGRAGAIPGWVALRPSASTRPSSSAARW